MNANRCVGLVSSCVLAAFAQTSFAGAIADLNENGFAWDVFDETTGFVKHTQNDPWSAYSEYAWASNWSTEKQPEAGTNYYSNGKLVYAPRMESGNPEFAGDLLVLDSNLRLMQASIQLTFKDFVGLGGGRILVGSTGEGIKTTGDMQFRSTPESPFSISQNSVFGKPSVFSVNAERNLSSVADAVVTLAEEASYVGSNRWWLFTIALSASDASGFLGKFLIPDAGLKLNVSKFGGEVELTNRWVDVAVHPVEGYAITNTPGTLSTGLDGGAEVAAVTLHRGTRFDLSNADWTVGDLKVSGAEISVNVSQSRNDGGFLTVTNSISVPGRVRIVNNASAWTSVDGDPVAIPIIRFSPEVDLSGISLDDFELISNPNNSRNYGSFPIQRLALRRCEDGSGELCITRNKIVANVHVETGQDRAWRYDTDEAATFWSDNKREHSGVDYMLYYNGRSPQYWIEKSTVFPAENFLFKNGEMFLKAEYVYFTNFVMVTGKASLAAKTTGGTDVLDGRLGVYSVPPDAVILGAEENMVLDIQSEVYGPGSIFFKGEGCKKLSGHNAGLAGRVVVGGGALHIGYGDSLGGACPSFAYDALTLTNGSAILPMRDIVLEEPSRGLFVSIAGTIDVPEGVSMDVKSVVTYNGVLAKKGAGVLSLSEKPRFADGSEDSAPQEGLNVLEVSEGAVKALAGEALNGLAVTFAEGAELRLPHMPEQEAFRKSGVVMTGALSSLAGAGSVVVRFDSASAIDSAFEQGVATFSTREEAEAFSGIVSFRPRPSGFAYRKNIVPNGSAFTVAVELAKIGFTVTVR